DVIFLFLGGFLLALAMEKWNLHKRIALRIIMLFGGSATSIIFGFIAATAFISMWISNTATALMMLPIAMAIIYKLENEFGKDKTKNFSVALMLSIAYCASIGGIATPIGTPPNLAFMKIFKIVFPQAPSVSFGTWMLIAVPISLLILLFTSFILLKVFYPVGKLNINKNFINDEYKKLGKINFEESIVGIVFSLTSLLWIFRADLNLSFIVIPGWQNLFPFPDFLNDGIVAIAMSFILFLIPSKKEKKKFILDSEIFNKVPWGIILLFGGGFALAEGFTKSGLSEFIGTQFYGMKDFSPFLITLSVAFVVIFLTELTSNTAVAQMILPIMASVSVAIGINPILLMITATISASLGFMMPVGTPPNTIVFASNKLKISEMVKAGFAINIVSIILVSVLIYLLGNFLFDFGSFPDWAKTPQLKD
ncbi:MAG TPA: DASS family sodium-coupled anion symporter, partial [Ignavibacteriaceae bacterium]|nr:DASS family sodium-coupled anion symporter [Ignavibacteriaceae bacterium]